MPGVGSPTYWDPDLSAPPSGYRPKPGSQLRHIRLVYRTNGLAEILPQTLHIACSPKKTVFNRFPSYTLLPALPHPHDGEATLGIERILREGITKLWPPGIVTREYNSLQFVTSKGEPGIQGSYL